MLNKALRLMAILAVLAACSWGACHSAQTRKLQQSTDGPMCLPGQICPQR